MSSLALRVLFWAEALSVLGGMDGDGVLRSGCLYAAGFRPGPQMGLPPFPLPPLIFP